jgi:hypothetical protein
MDEYSRTSDLPVESTHFPPLMTPVRLRERQDAFQEAMRGGAGDGDAYQGAGSLFYVGRFELIEFALVLEPVEPLHLARKIFYAGMNALADALAVISPPEKAVTFRYPGSLYFDGALVGGARLGVPPACAENETPLWLVFGAMVRAGGMRELGPGMSPDLMSPEITTLDDEGFDSWNPAEFSATFARHFLVEVDSWSEHGMRGIAQRYLDRLEKTAGDGVRGIDENGDLLVHPAQKNRHENAVIRRISLARGLVRPDWFDPLLNEPRA